MAFLISHPDSVLFYSFTGLSSVKGKHSPHVVFSFLFKSEAHTDHCFTVRKKANKLIAQQVNISFPKIKSAGLTSVCLQRLLIFILSFEQKCPGADKGDWAAATDAGGPERQTNTLHLSVLYQVSHFHLHCELACVLPTIANNINVFNGVQFS